MFKKLRKILSNNSIFFFVGLLLIVLPYRLNKIDQPLVNITNFRQAQTATVALNFYKNGINLSQTELDIFGKGKEKYLTLEFPVYEAAVAVLYKIFYVSDLWGRLVSVLMGIIGGWFFYQLLLLLKVSRKISILSCFFYLFVPLNMYHQRDFLIETTVISFLLAGSYFFLRYSYFQGVKNYLAAVILLSLGIIQKGMYGPFWFLPLTYLYFQNTTLNRYSVIKFMTLIGIPLVSLFIWQKHVDYLNIINGHSYFTSFNQGHVLWNLGSISDRIDISLWNFRINNLMNGIFLKPGLILIIFGLWATVKLRERAFFYLWLLAEIIYFLLFFRIQSHIYYQMVMIPVISLFMATGLDKIGNILGKILQKYYLRINFKPLLITFFCSFFLWKSYLNAQWDKVIDWKWYQRLQKVGYAAPKNTYGILVNPGYDWNSVYTYYPKLKLKLVSIEEVTTDMIPKWKKDGYYYMILHEYDKYNNYLSELKLNNNLDFLKKYNEILSLEDFKVLLL